MSFTLLKVDDLSGIREYYDEYGYVVVDNITPSLLIDNFLKEYNNLKNRSWYAFQAQDTNRFEKMQLTREGLLEHSVHHPLRLPFAKKFAESASKVVMSDNASSVLAALTDKKVHTIRQTMFFDRSTGTAPHQDHYYLDSYPCGHQVSCWYALEDIHEDSGVFYVVPGSHKGPLIDHDPDVGYSDHERYVAQIENLMVKENYKETGLTVPRGSGIFWHPNTVHGAFPNIDPKRSRKSLTAHVIPEGYDFWGGGSWKKALASRPVDNTDFRVINNSDPSHRRLRDYVRYMLGAMKSFKGDSRGRPDMEMRSNQYDGNNKSD